jgi:heme O synthase-like polyprenyltransferase
MSCGSYFRSPCISILTRYHTIKKLSNSSPYSLNMLHTQVTLPHDSLHYLLTPKTSDILDRNFDGKVPRTASRPLPSGRISLTGALIAWISWIAITTYGVVYLQDQDKLILWLPSWILSSIYPLAKRFVVFPQIVLGSAVSCVLIPAWITGNGGQAGRGELLPIVLFIVFWIVYIDMFYATMVGPLKG